MVLLLWVSQSGLKVKDAATEKDNTKSIVNKSESKCVQSVCVFIGKFDLDRWSALNTVSFVHGRGVEHMRTAGT